jgi:hypothetical protein
MCIDHIFKNKLSTSLRPQELPVGMAMFYAHLFYFIFKFFLQYLDIRRCITLILIGYKCGFVAWIEAGRLAPCAKSQSQKMYLATPRKPTP